MRDEPDGDVVRECIRPSAASRLCVERLKHLH